MKLIDQMGDFQDAVNDTAKAVRISGEPVLVHPEKERKTMSRPAIRRCFPVVAHPGEAARAASGVLFLWK